MNPIQVGQKVLVKSSVLNIQLETVVAAIQKWQLDGRKYILIECDKGWPFKNCSNDSELGHNLKPDSKVIYVSSDNYQAI